MQPQPKNIKVKTKITVFMYINNKGTKTARTCKPGHQKSQRKYINNRIILILLRSFLNEAVKNLRLWIWRCTIYIQQKDLTSQRVKLTRFLFSFTITQCMWKYWNLWMEIRRNTHPQPFLWFLGSESQSGSDNSTTVSGLTIKNSLISIPQFRISGLQDFTINYSVIFLLEFMIWPSIILWSRCPKTWVHTAYVDHMHTKNMWRFLI